VVSLNQRCALALDLESILRAQTRKILFDSIDPTRTLARI